MAIYRFRLTLVIYMISLGMSSFIGKKPFSLNSLQIICSGQNTNQMGYIHNVYNGIVTCSKIGSGCSEIIQSN